MLWTAMLGFARAQEVTGSIVGTVTDASGGVVRGASVTITDSGKNIIVRAATTNDAGEYAALLLPAGNYIVTIEAPGFKKFVGANTKLDVNQRRAINATLAPGAVSEVITVESDPLQVETQSVVAGTLISGAQVRELSLNSRHFGQLVTLMPGVSTNLPDQLYVGTTRPDGRVNLVSISVNGSRSSANNWRVDGADITDRGSNLTIQLYPSVDAIDEFKVLRSLYPAEEGRAAGGQVNVIIKSGTNQFHGDVFEFLRNDALNANSFFLNRARAERPPLRYNDYGFTVGGPLYFPKKPFGPLAYNEEKKKTFFFYSMEWRSTINYSVFRPTVPSGALKRGVFPVDVCVEVDAQNNCVRMGRQITNINPVAQAYINDIFAGLPEPGADGTITSPQRNVFKFRQELLKIDHNFSDRLSVSYRLEYDTIPTVEPNALFSSGSQLPGVSTTKTDSPGRSHVARFTYSITPKTILEGGYAYTWGAIQSQPFGKLLLSNSTVRVPLPFQNMLGRIPTLSFSNLNGTSTFGPYDNFSSNQNAFANISKIVGSHTLKFGATFGFLRKHENQAGGNEGSFSFAGDDINQEWASFLLGAVDSFSQNSKDLTNDLRQRAHEFYAQDEWRARQNLTLYYGLRYSLFRRPYDTNHFFTNFVPSLFDPSRAFRVNGGGNRVPGSGDPLNGVIVNGQNSPYGDNVTSQDNNDIAPRIGVAWDPFKKGTTSVRAGYGIYYDLSTYAFYQDASVNNPPFAGAVTIDGTRLDNPASGPVQIDNSTVSLNGIGVPYITPYTQDWSLDVQRQLTGKTLLDVGYYGSRASHLPGIIDLNLIQPGLALNSTCVNSSGARVPCQRPGQVFTTASSELILDQIRPFPGYRAINVVQNRFNSNYHSLQVYLQRRLTGNSQINVAYTWAKNLTDSQTDRSTAPMNPYDIRAEYGRAQLDRRHVLTINYVYELPFFRDQRGAAGHLLGGWELSGITVAETGLPFTVTRSANDPGGIGLLGPSAAGGRPDLVGDPNSNAPHTAAKWFNTSAFANVPTGVNRPGDSGRGVVTGPGLQRWDISLFKNIKVTEAMRFQFRAEAFNIFNHTNFTTLSTSLSASTFGQATAAADARIIQFGLKFYY